MAYIDVMSFFPVFILLSIIQTVGVNHEDN